MTQKKYKLLKTDKTTIDGKPLFQVQALISFRFANKGDKGGYVQSKKNLSQDGTRGCLGTHGCLDVSISQGKRR